MKKRETFGIKPNKSKEFRQSARTFIIIYTKLTDPTYYKESENAKNFTNGAETPTPKCLYSKAFSF